MAMPDRAIKISCRQVSKIFGPRPHWAQRELDAGLGKGEVLAKTGHVVAVNNVSFEVRQGEIFVVMGLSGSGKSTLIRCISRLIEPTRGQIFVDGVDVMGMNQEQLRELRRHKMSMVFQHFGLFPHRRVLDNVAFGLEVHGTEKGIRQERAMQVLTLVGLRGWENHFPHELSGGMQQRVGLARALAVDPEFLLCDEPFSALDPLIRREMQGELLNLQKLVRKTIIFITHDFLEALKLGDHICIMKDGEFVQVGTPEEVVAHPADDYVREFTKDVPRAKVLTAKTIMSPCPVLVPSDETLGVTVSRLKDSGSEMACVVDDSGRFLGSVSPSLLEESIARESSTKPVSITMRQDMSSVDAACTLESLVPHLAGHNNSVVVVDQDARPLGYVTRQSVMLAIAGDVGG